MEATQVLVVRAVPVKGGGYTAVVGLDGPLGYEVAWRGTNDALVRQNELSAQIDAARGFCEDIYAVTHALHQKGFRGRVMRWMVGLGK